MTQTNGKQAHKTIHSIGSASDQVNEFIRCSDEVISDLKDADLVNVAGKIKQLQVDFDRDTTEIAQQFAMYLDPEAKVSVAILKAARLIHDRVQTRRVGNLPFGVGYSGSLPGVPSVPSVASLYTDSPATEQPQTVTLPSLPAQPNETHGNGKPQTVAGKGFSVQAKN